MTADEKTLQKFELLLVTVFASKQPEAIDNQLDYDDKYQHKYKKEYDGLMKIVVTTKKAALLSQLLVTYLTNYERNKDKKNNVHYYRSDELFFHIIQQSAYLDPDNRIHFGDTVDTFLDKDAAAYGLFMSRISDLSKTVLSKVQYFFAYEKKKLRETKSAVDFLKKAYEKKYGFKVAKLDDLYEFDPYPDSELKTDFDFWETRSDSMWKWITSSYSEESSKQLNELIDDYAKFARKTARQDILKIFQIIKYFLNRIRTRRENASAPVTPGSGHPLTLALYLIACKHAVFEAARQGLQNNRYWLTDQERDYFTGAIKKDLYISNHKKLLETKTSEIDSAVDQAKALVNMLAISKTFKYGLYLVDAEEADKIADFWTKTEVLLYKLKDKTEDQQLSIVMEEKNLPTFLKFATVAGSRVDNKNGPVLSQGSWGVGSTIGSHPSFGSAAIVHIEERSGWVYIEFANLKKQLFRIQQSSAFFGDYAYGARIKEIHQNTIGIVYVNQIIMMAIPFLPVLIESGFAALCYEIGLYLVSIKVEHLVSKIDPTLGKIAGLATQLLVPRPKAPGINAGVAADDAVHVVNVEQQGVARSFEQKLNTALEEEPLLTDFNRGTLGKMKNKIDDTMGTLPEISLDNASLAAKKVADKIPQEIRVGSMEPALAGGPNLRVSQTSNRGLGTQGTGGKGVSFVNKASAKLKKSDVYKQLDDYYQYLEKGEANIAEAAAKDIIKKLENNAIKITEAENKLKAILNTAKEQTGEYVAESFVRSNFKVIDVVRIPHRGAGAPVLDLVFKVKGANNRIEYLLIEAKGGPYTKLGEVTPKIYRVEKGQIITTVTNGNMVKQASPEWYFQKIVEIYQSKGYQATTQANAALEREYQKLAREMLSNARQGKVSTIVIKSGSAMDPKFKFSADEFIKYFSMLKFEFPKT